MQNVPLEILRVKSVLAATGLSRTTLWRRVRSGDFPRPLRLGGPKSRCVGWRAEEIAAWLESRERTGFEVAES